MELLVAVLHAHQDFDRLPSRTAGSTLTAWKRRSSERSFSMYLRYSAGVVAPMQRISPRLSAGLRMLAGVERAFRRTRADERVQLVDEHDDVRVLGQLLHDRLEALFELAAILGAGDDQRDVEREDALVGEEVRHVAVDDLLRQPFDDGGLADAGLADEDGVVLRPAAEHLLDALDLDVRADQRVERFFIAASVRSRLNSASSGVSFTRVSVVFSFSSATMSSRTVFRRIPFSMRIGRRDGSLFAQDAEQQVLGADVVVQQPVGLFGRELQDTLGFGAERNLDRRRDLLAEYGAPFDFLADRFERQMRAGKDPAREPFALANQAEEQVLGFDRDAAELGRFIPCEEQHAPRPFRVTFEHPGFLE
jgi:hypothetical protein